MKKTEFKCNVSQFLGKRKSTVNSEIPLKTCSKIVQKNLDKDSLDSSQNETPQAADEAKIIEFHQPKIPTAVDSAQTQSKWSIPPEKIDSVSADLPLDTNAVDSTQLQSSWSIPSAKIDSGNDDFLLDTNAADSAQTQSKCSTPSADISSESDDLPMDTNAVDSTQLQSSCSIPPEIDSESDDLPLDTNAVDSTQLQSSWSIPSAKIDSGNDDFLLDTNAADSAQTQSKCSTPSADISSESDDLPMDTNAVDSTQLQSSCSIPPEIDSESDDLSLDTNAVDSTQLQSSWSIPPEIDSESDDLSLDTNAVDSTQLQSSWSIPPESDSESDDLPFVTTKDSLPTQSKCSTPSTDIDSESDDFPLSIYKAKELKSEDLKDEDSIQSKIDKNQIAKSDPTTILIDNFPTNIVKIEKGDVDLDLIDVESCVFNDSAVVDLTMDEGQEEKNEAAKTSLEHLYDSDDSDELFDEIDPDAAEHSKFFENSNSVDAELDGVKNDLNFINNDLMEQLLPKDLPTQNEILEGLKNMGPRWNENAQAFYKQKKATKEALDNVFVLLKECPDDNDYAEDPDGLDVKLMRHQQRALKWMTWREKKRPFGGILADDMGLGKTLSVIALVLQEKNTLESDSEEGENDWNLTDGGTLVICPTSLLRQWEKEILQKTKCATLMPLVFYGNNHPKDIERLSTFDIVITTYRTVCGQRGKHLFNINWRRIVVDEAHIIRNANTQTSEFICSLKAKHRWALTGTPIHNKETDIYALLKFLRYRPFDDKSCWTVWLRDRKRLSVVVRSSMLRRTKVDLLAENAVFKLPPRHEELIEIDLSEEELLVHHTVLSFSKTLFEKFLAQRNAERYGMDRIALASARDEKFFTSKEYEEFLLRLQGPRDDKRIGSYVILVLLLRLRQICCHPGLAKAILYDEDDTETSDFDISEDSQNNEPFTKENSHVKEEAVRIKEEAVMVKEETPNVQEEFPDVKKELPDVKHENDDIKEELRDMEEETKKPKKLPSIRKILNCHNPVYDFSNPSTKIKRLMEVLDERVLRKREKAIIVSSWSKFLEIMGSHLEIAGVRTLHFNGGMSVEDRLQVLENFHNNQKESKVLLLTLTAGGVGLNLVAANHLFLMEPHWNPQMEAQAQDRIYRMGQERNVYIYKFICQNSIEERIKAIQESKLEMAKTILTGAAAISGGRLTLQDLMKLFGVVDFRMKKSS